MQTPPPFDRAALKRDDLDFLDASLGDGRSLLLPIWRGQAVVEPGADSGPPSLHIATVETAGAWLDAADELVFLGLLDDRPCFGVALDGPAAPSATGTRTEAIDLRLAGSQLSRWEAELGAYARGLLHWHAHSAHCGRCGQPTRARQGGHMRSCGEGGCGTELYPRTDPAILVLITHGDRVLLGRQAVWPRGMYSALAGFVETGESVEEAVVREVREEAGVEIEDLRYVRSQPWPFPSSLMLGYRAAARSDQLAPGDDELEDLRWFSRAQLRDPASTGIEGFFVPPNWALAGTLIEAFLGETPLDG